MKINLAKAFNSEYIDWPISKLIFIETRLKTKGIDKFVFIGIALFFS